jgi:hypothetical protein
MHTDALAVDLAQLRRRPTPSSTRALELDLAILRLEGARLAVRAATTKSAEDQAKFHLKMAAAHLRKLTKLHPGLPTWTPPKAKKKGKKKHVAPAPPKPVGTHLVYPPNGGSK